MRKYQKLTAFLLALSLAACSFLQPAAAFAAEDRTERTTQEFGAQDEGSQGGGASQGAGTTGQEETKPNDMKQEGGAEQETGLDGTKPEPDSDGGNRDVEGQGTEQPSGTENEAGNETEAEPVADGNTETLPEPTTEGEDNLDPGEDVGFSGTPGELETYGAGLASSMAALGLRLLGRSRGWDPGSLGLSGTVYARAYNEGGSTLSDAFGFEKSDLLSWMHGQATTGYYLGTIYDGGDNRNPNGDPSYNGRDVRPGQAGLNCTGFVWHMLMKAGARVTGESDGRNTSFVGNTGALLAAGANVDNSGTSPTVPGESGWVAFLSSSNVEYKTYVADGWDDMVKVLVADDYWDAGDVIWTWDLKNPLTSGSGGNNAKFPNADVAQRILFTEGMYGHAASGLSWGDSAHNHILLYCGTDFARYCDSATNNYAQYVSGTGDQLVWHSSEVHFNSQTWQPDGSTPWNQITSIFPKETGGPYAVTIVKTGGKGTLNLKKTSSNAALTDGNGCYSLEGATYLVFRSEADARNGAENLAVATLVTDANGDSNTVEVAPGTYYVKETVASMGYALDRTIHQVTVESGRTATVRSVEIPQSDPVSIILGKVDAETNANKPQGSASLGGAEFTVKYYNGLYDSDPAAQGQTPSRTWVLRTEADGYCRLGERYKVSGDDFYKLEGVVTLPLGTITIQESKAPTGYLINNEVFVRKITSVGHAEQVNTYNQPVVPETPQKLKIRLKKVDAGTGLSVPQGAGTLAGAVYGVYDASGAKVDTLTTDAKGEAGSKELPLGNYTVKETKASNGYLLDETAHPVNGSVPKDQATRVFTYKVGSGEDVIRGDVEIVKFIENLDADDDTIQGLAGIEFTFTSKTTGEKALVITTDKNGFATTASKDNPRGTLVFDTYTVEETRHPANVKPIKPFEVTISEEGVTLKGIYKEDKLIVSPVTVVKKDKGSGKTIPAANVTFRLLDENKEPVTMTTRYPDKVVHETFKTNENGQFTFPDVLTYGTYYLEELDAPEGYLKGGLLKFAVTEGSTWEEPLVVEYADENAMGRIRIEKADAETEEALAGATFEIVAAEDVVTPDGTLRVAKGDVADVVTTGKDGRAESKDLFLGKYVVRETRQPDGFILNKEEHEVELAYAGQDVPVVYGFVEAENKPTRLFIYKLDEETGEPLAGVEFEIWNKDMEPGADKEEVDVEGVNMDEAGDGNADAETDAKTDDGDDSIDAGMSVRPVLITSDDGRAEISHLAPGTYCIREVKTLPGYVLDEMVHEFTVGEDGLIDGKEVGVRVFENTRTKLIGTTAVSADTGAHEGVPGREVTIIDTVAFEDLQPGEEYTVKGTLMDAETGKEYLVDEKPVTAETRFVPETKDGSVDVVFTFDGSGLVGRKVVVFEKAFVCGVEILSHEDIEDEDQTVEFPKPEIKTTAVDAETGSHESVAAGEVTIVDTVKYEGLVVGQEYTVKGVLMDKATGERLLVDGKEVTAEAKFTPKEKDGSVDVTFTFDAGGLMGSKVVAFESLYVKGVEVAVHADIEDEDQTVEFPEPKIRTTATDAENGTHESLAVGEVTIVDTVKYEGLVVGQKYTVKGTLMDKATGKELLVDGQAVTSEKTFVAEAKDGSVRITFTFDAGGLMGNKVVAFERLYVKGVEVAAHADIEDDGQTVRFPTPEIRTTAVNAETGTHEAAATKEVAIVDTVRYENLVIGQEYTVKGVLMDKATGEKLLVDGKEVTSEAKFVPEEKDGSVDVTFTFDARGLEGTKVVAFESLYAKGVEVAVHADIEDDDQTVGFPEPEIGTTAVDKETGTHEAVAARKVTIVDTVAYKNLVVGQEYTVKGVLMDKETGRELFAGGRKVTADATFKPEAKDGSVTVEFTFDASGLMGREVVAFESLYAEGVEVAVHADVEDEGQTVKIKEPEKPPVPKTGDFANELPFAAGLMAASCAALALGGVKMRKRKKTGEGATRDEQ